MIQLPGFIGDGFANSAVRPHRSAGTLVVFSLGLQCGCEDFIILLFPRQNRPRK
jgi:hypothetical protein